MYKSMLIACALCAATPVFAEGPAAGPSSQGGDASDVAPSGVEKPLEPTRVIPDASEGMPPQNAEPPNKLDEPKVNADPEQDAKEQDVKQR